MSLTLMRAGQMPLLYLTDLFANKKHEVRSLFSHSTNVQLKLYLIIIYMSKHKEQTADTKLKQVDYEKQYYLKSIYPSYSANVYE